MGDQVSWVPLVDRFGSRRLGHYRSCLLTTRHCAGERFTPMARPERTTIPGATLPVVGPMRCRTRRSPTAEVVGHRLKARLSPRGRVRAQLDSSNTVVLS